MSRVQQIQHRAVPHPLLPSRNSGTRSSTAANTRLLSLARRLEERQAPAGGGGGDEHPGSVKCAGASLADHRTIAEALGGEGPGRGGARDAKGLVEMERRIARLESLVGDGDVADLYPDLCSALDSLEARVALVDPATLKAVGSCLCVCVCVYVRVSLALSRARALSLSRSLARSRSLRECSKVIRAPERRRRRRRSGCVFASVFNNTTQWRNQKSLGCKLRVRRRMHARMLTSACTCLARVRVVMRRKSEIMSARVLSVCAHVFLFVWACACAWACAQESKSRSWRHGWLPRKVEP